MEAEERTVKRRRLSSPHKDDHIPRLLPSIVTNEVSTNGKLESPTTAARNTVPPSPKHVSLDKVSQDSELFVEDPSKSHASTKTAPSDPPLSKSKLKKLRRQEQWEAGREARKVKKKEKKVQKKFEKELEQRQQEPPIDQSPSTEQPNILAALQQPSSDGVAPSRRRPLKRSTQLPVTLIFDCGFDDMMLDKERISLAAQVTRAYSENHHAKYRAHLAITSFGGKLKERFETVLARHHESWKGVRFFEEDFVEVTRKAEEWMDLGKGGGVLEGAFAPLGSETVSIRASAANGHAHTPADTESDMPITPTGEVVYLTSDSPNTLTTLKPNSTYIIGGLVDRNRHKGICYKRAVERGIETAKFPIGEYMEMTSRFVLATNHVAEIMLKWLEYGDWGKAFLEVIPKRKGGVLKGKSEEGDELNENSGSGAQHAEQCGEGDSTALAEADQEG